MWCGSVHPQVILKQPRVALNLKPLTDPKAVPTYLVAAEKLLLDINKEHAGCLAAAEAARAKAATAAPHPAEGMCTLSVIHMQPLHPLTACLRARTHQLLYMHASPRQHRQSLH